MKIDKTFWFTGSYGTIGVVVGEDSTTKKKKAYIGVGGGFDRRRDIDHIATEGSPVNPGVIREILEALTNKKLVVGQRILCTLGVTPSSYNRIEAKVLEIGPSGTMVKLQYLNKSTAWEDIERVHVAEVLPYKW